MIGEIDPPQQPRALLLAREVQEQLHDPEPVLRQVALPVVDLAVAALPHLGARGLRRKLLAVEVLGVHAHGEHLLVVGAVEDADLAARRQALGVAPHEVVIQLLGGRDLEAVDPDALRVDAAHHVPDRPVLAGAVQRLQHDEDPPAVLSGQTRLVDAQQLDSLLEQRHALLLLLDPGLERRIEIPGELDAAPRSHPERLDEARQAPAALIAQLCGHPSTSSG